MDISKLFKYCPLRSIDSLSDDIAKLRKMNYIGEDTMRSILFISLMSFSLLVGCAAKPPAYNSITVSNSRAAVLDGYKKECMNDYGYKNEGSDLLASCIQSKDQASKLQSGKKIILNGDFSEKFNEILNEGSYTFKS
tara:strand:- start:369 stop:779 length:411 start_codon:yes stop_codon:yes gene_type:complete